MHGNRLLTALDMDIMDSVCNDLWESVNAIPLTHSWSAITDKPSFSDVAFSGSYVDLDGTPDLSDVAISGNYSDLAGVPSFSPVALSGDYNDLSGKPSIPNVAGLGSRISTIENKFGAGKAAAIPSFNITPTASSVNILGIEVVTASAFTALVSAFNSLKNSHNSLLAASKSWGWMAT